MRITCPVCKGYNAHVGPIHVLIVSHNTYVCLFSLIFFLIVCILHLVNFRMVAQIRARGHEQSLSMHIF